MNVDTGSPARSSGGLQVDSRSVALHASPNPGALNVLYDTRSGQRLSAKASLLHAMAKSEISAAQIKELRGEVEQELRVGPNTVEIDEPDSDRYEAVLSEYTYVDHLPSADENAPRRRASDLMPASAPALLPAPAAVPGL